MKNYIGISRDHSASMRPYKVNAARDYNLNVENIRTASQTENLNTIVSTVLCGYGPRATVHIETVNANVNSVLPINENRYDANGPGTPLFASVGRLIQIFEDTPDAKDPDVSFLIMAITDGEENASAQMGWTARRLGDAISRLQATGRWTFAFRVPKGKSAQLANLGIPVGNIQEWELTSDGLEHSTQTTTQSFTQYYSNLSRGVKSTDKFFVSADHLNPAAISQKLTNIDSQVDIWENRNHNRDIAFAFNVTHARDFYKTGTVFYELIKTETVQPKKKIAIRDKSNGHVYSGYYARQLLGLPENQYIKVVPGNHNKYDIFIQSTSSNRKVLAGQKLLYWKNV